jgi:hypothetical protein
MLVVSPIEHDSCPAPHTAQENRHIQRLGYFIPEFVGGGQDTPRRLAVFAEVKNHFQSIHPVFAPHFSNRNYPSSSNHFFTSIILCYPKYPSGISEGIGVSFENGEFSTTF